GRWRRYALGELGAGTLWHPQENEERARRDQRDGDERRLEIGGASDAGVAARPQCQLDRERSDRDPDRDRHLLGDRDKRGGTAHLAVVDLGIGEGVEARELERTEEAADDQHADDPDE